MLSVHITPNLEISQVGAWLACGGGDLTCGRGEPPAPRPAAAACYGAAWPRLRLSSWRGLPALPPPAGPLRLPLLAHQPVLRVHEAQAQHPRGLDLGESRRPPHTPPLAPAAPVARWRQLRQAARWRRPLAACCACPRMRCTAHHPLPALALGAHL